MLKTLKWPWRSQSERDRSKSRVLHYKSNDLLTTFLEQEILRRAKELDARVKKPAEAEKYRMEIAAEAARQRLVLEAEAEAELIRLRGEAQAYAINEKAKAEAEQMRKKAEAWKHYKDAAIVDMVLETLPKVNSLIEE